MRVNFSHYTTIVINLVLLLVNTVEPNDLFTINIYRLTLIHGNFPELETSDLVILPV